MASKFRAERMFDLLKGMDDARDTAWRVAGETGHDSRETFRAKLRHASAVVRCAEYLHFHFGVHGIASHIGECAVAGAREFIAAWARGIATARTGR